jgi:hypothetical protein
MHGEMRNAYKIFIRNPDETRSLRYMRKWENTIKIDTEVTGPEVRIGFIWPRKGKSDGLLWTPY